MTEFSPKTIVISRTDSIGDVILTLPLAGILKEKYPDSKIIFLGNSYTESIVRVSVYIDEFINWDELKNDARAIETLKEYKADFFIHVFPNKKIAYLVSKAKIPNRIGTAGRAYHFFTCNKKVYFSRKKSNLHESQLNLKLLAPLGIKNNIPLAKLETYYGFTKTKKIPVWLSDEVSKSKVNIILHPKSKGSALEWGLKNFSRLINQLPEDEFKIFITGTKDEGKLIGESLPFEKKNVISLIGKLSLDELIAFILACDGLVAASTGPLHIAAALGKRAIGLFSARKPIHPGRWAPLGIQSESLVFDQDCVKCRKKEHCDCINKIPVEHIISLLGVRL
jgi:heptosyltransferase III